MENTTVWVEKDAENNVWQCMECGCLHQFEADGPEENSFDYCPTAGGALPSMYICEICGARFDEPVIRTWKEPMPDGYFERNRSESCPHLREPVFSQGGKRG